MSFAFFRILSTISMRLFPINTMIAQKVMQKYRQGKKFLLFSGLKVFSDGFLLVIIILLAKFLTPERYGSFSLGMMIVYFFNSIGMLSSQTPFIIYANEERTQTEKINISFTSRLCISSFSVLLFAAIVGIFSSQLSQFAFLSPPETIALFFAYLGINLRVFVEGIFLGSNKKITCAFYSSLYTAVASLYLTSLIFFHELNLQRIFLMFLVAALFSTLLFLPAMDFKSLLPLKFQKKDFLRMLHYTKWVMVGGVAMYFINWGDNLILRYFVTLEEIGMYNLGYQIFKGLILIITAMSLYFLPAFSGKMDNLPYIRRYFQKKRPLIFLFWCFSMVCLYFFIPLAFQILYGNQYDLSIIVAQVLLFASIFALYRRFYEPFFNAAERYRFVQTSNIFFVMLNLLLDILLIPPLGALGAAIATTIAYCAIMVAHEIYFRKNFPEFVEKK